MNKYRLLGAKTIYTYKVNVKKKTIKCLIDLYENEEHMLVKTKLTFDDFLNLVRNRYTPLGFKIEANGFLQIRRSELRPYQRILRRYIKHFKKHWVWLRRLDPSNKENYY